MSLFSFISLPLGWCLFIAASFYLIFNISSFFWWCNYTCRVSDVKLRCHRFGRSEWKQQGVGTRGTRVEQFALSIRLCTPPPPPLTHCIKQELCIYQPIPSSALWSMWTHKTAPSVYCSVSPSASVLVLCSPATPVKPDANSWSEMGWVK